MATFRINKTKAFTQIDNGTLSDSLLSFEAIGVLVYLLSKPDTWEASRQDVVNHGSKNGRKFGRHKTRKAFSELEAAGYMHRTNVRKPNGKFITKNDIFDHKVKNPYWSSPASSEQLAMYFETDNPDSPLAVYDQFTEDERILMRDKMLAFCLNKEIPIPQEEKEWAIIEHPNFLAWTIHISSKWRSWPTASFIVKEMGDRHPDVAALVRANELWHASPYNPDNIVGIIEWYNEMIPPKNSEPIVRKWHYDAFEDTELDLLLKTNGIKTLLMTGFISNVCVETTARHGFIKGYYIVAVSDCTDAPTKQEYESAMYNIRIYFGKVATSREITALWK